MRPMLGNLLVPVGVEGVLRNPSGWGQEAAQDTVQLHLPRDRDRGTVGGEQFWETAGQPEKGKGSR